MISATLEHVHYRHIWYVQLLFVCKHLLSFSSCPLFVMHHSSVHLVHKTLYTANFFEFYSEYICIINLQVVCVCLYSLLHACIINLSD